MSSTLGESLNFTHIYEFIHEKKYINFVFSNKNCLFHFHGGCHDTSNYKVYHFHSLIYNLQFTSIQTNIKTQTQQLCFTVDWAKGDVCGSDV